jgi:hypothetical protein
MESWNDFPENEDETRKEEKVKEEREGIEGRMSTLRESKRWRSSEG